MNLLLVAALATESASPLAHLALEAPNGPTLKLVPVPWVATAIVAASPIATLAIANGYIMSWDGRFIVLGAGVAAGATVLNVGYAYAGDPLRGSAIAAGAVGIAGLGLVGIPMALCALGCGSGTWGRRRRGIPGHGGRRGRPDRLLRLDAVRQLRHGSPHRRAPQSEIEKPPRFKRQASPAGRMAPAGTAHGRGWQPVCDIITP
ncbi:MAG: hypothetical protein FJZ00_10235 [Candidatus Sericytochromatia bacterium]|uniref:Uncharacterized protein n=1 Tax=Candidatus Tanganyikabacteria bacterium TaxID=2961651 RepID=A0A938BNL9_9BACT|nr:hypothetical protein [Candidatus Tanganyikabacteria bacterium]